MVCFAARAGALQAHLRGSARRGACCLQNAGRGQVRRAAVSVLASPLQTLRARTSASFAMPLKTLVVCGSDLDVDPPAVQVNFGVRGGLCSSTWSQMGFAR